jgi:hypothetical protein
MMVAKVGDAYLVEEGDAVHDEDTGDRFGACSDYVVPKAMTRPLLFAT